jgi:hypothetical protein
MEKNWKTELKKYIDEARGLGLFMISAGFFDAVCNTRAFHFVTSFLLPCYAGF